MHFKLPHCGSFLFKKPPNDAPIRDAVNSRKIITFYRYIYLDGLGPLLMLTSNTYYDSVLLTSRRLSLVLRRKLRAEFDKFISRRKYSDRSEASRDLTGKAFVKDERKAGREVVGVITLVYDHHRHQLQGRITELRHDYRHQITSTTHAHMGHDNCPEGNCLRA